MSLFHHIDASEVVWRESEGDPESLNTKHKNLINSVDKYGSLSSLAKRTFKVLYCVSGCCQLSHIYYTSASTFFYRFLPLLPSYTLLSNKVLLHGYAMNICFVCLFFIGIIFHGQMLYTAVFTAQVSLQCLFIVGPVCECTQLNKQNNTKHRVMTLKMQ